MLRLPALTAGNFTWRLPLCGATGMGLMSAILREDHEQRTAAVTGLLANDPALTLWCVCRARIWRNETPACLEAIADHFSNNAETLLQWPAGGNVLQSVPTRDERLRWSNLAAAGVSAYLAAGQDTDDDDKGPALVGALLHGATDWLASSGPAVTAAESLRGESCIPRWLARLLSELDESPARSFLAMRVAGAVASLAAPGGQPGDLPENPNGVPVARDWLDDQHESPTALLPALMQRVLRLKQLETEFDQRLETEKLEALKELAYGASHEINNPLANISTRAQTLLRDETDPERRQKLAVIHTQAFRAYEMIADMMLFARPPKLEFTMVDLTALIDQVIGELAETADIQDTEILRVTSDEPLLVAADAGHLAVAIKALCDNSIEAIGGGGRIELFAQAADPPGEDGREFVEIQVADTGPGIADEVKRHLFDPYYSGREAGRGLGLGLSKCWRIVHDHDGWIDVESTLDQGAVFTIRLPRKK